MFTDQLIHRVSKILPAEKKLQLLIYIGELEVLREKGIATNQSEEKVIKRTDQEHKLFINALLLSITRENPI